MEYPGFQQQNLFSYHVCPVGLNYQRCLSETYHDIQHSRPSMEARQARIVYGHASFWRTEEMGAFLMIRPDSITTRLTLPTDEDFLYQVYASTRIEELALVPWTEEQKDAFVQMQFELRDQQYRAEYPDRAAEIILCNDVAAGTMITAQTEETIFLVDIALLPQFRGSGAGTCVLQSLQAQGKKIILHVAKDNPAQHLYTRLGFVIVDEDSMYLGMEWNPR